MPKLRSCICKERLMCSQITRKTVVSKNRTRSKEKSGGRIYANLRRWNDATARQEESLAPPRIGCEKEGSRWGRPLRLLWIDDRWGPINDASAWYVSEWRLTGYVTMTRTPGCEPMLLLFRDRRRREFSISISFWRCKKKNKVRSLPGLRDAIAPSFTPELDLIGWSDPKIFHLQWKISIYLHAFNFILITRHQ